MTGVLKDDRNHGTMHLRSSHSRVLGCIVLASLVADVLLKSPANRQEIMWACYWASGALAMGMLIGSENLVSGAVIFFAGLGLPAWIISILIDGQTEATSVLIHVVPLLAGLHFVSRLAVLPKHSAAFAWLLFGIPFALSWHFCDPAAMINLSHWTRWPIPQLVPHPWQFYIALLLLSVALVNSVAIALKSILERASGPALSAP
jgi:hypothetical protein